MFGPPVIGMKATPIGCGCQITTPTLPAGRCSFLGTGIISSIIVGYSTPQSTGPVATILGSRTGTVLAAFSTPRCCWVPSIFIVIAEVTTTGGAMVDSITTHHGIAATAMAISIAPYSPTTIFVSHATTGIGIAASIDSIAVTGATSAATDTTGTAIATVTGIVDATATGIETAAAAIAMTSGSFARRRTGGGLPTRMAGAAIGTCPTTIADGLASE